MVSHPLPPIWDCTRVQKYLSCPRCPWTKDGQFVALPMENCTSHHLLISSRLVGKVKSPGWGHCWPTLVRAQTTQKNYTCSFATSPVILILKTSFANLKALSCLLVKLLTTARLFSDGSFLHWGARHLLINFIACSSSVNQEEGRALRRIGHSGAIVSTTWATLSYHLLMLQKVHQPYLSTTFPKPPKAFLDWVAFKDGSFSLAQAPHKEVSPQPG